MDSFPMRGTGIFGPAYQVMLEHDIHAPGSVDRMLVERMVLIHPKTVRELYGGFTPSSIAYRAGRLPTLERYAREATDGARTPGEKTASIVQFCRGLRERSEASETRPDAWKDMLFGGTEEAIIERGTDWCADLARVACALCQVSGVPARIVQLADLIRAYSGHVIIEALIDGKWGAVDPLYAILYRDSNGRPVTTWDLMRNPQLITAAGGKAHQFRAGAVSNYFIWERESYDYSESTLDGNSYYGEILRMSGLGWPGGLRWLHGEDDSGPEPPPRRM